MTAELYGVDELAALAGLLGAGSFPGADGLPPHPDAREAALRSARRSLLARGALEIDDEGILRVAPPHSLLAAVALAPAAVVTAERRGPAGLEARSFYVRPEVAVEHATEVGHVHRLARFEPAELVDRLLELSGLELRAAVEREAFEAPTKEVEATLAAQLNGAALSFTRVRSLAQSRSGRRIVGGELAWFDAGDAGLWRVEPVRGDPERVEVRPVGSGDLVDELLSYLPGAERQPAT